MSKEKRRVPNLRFPGFTEDWEQRKFGELFILKSGVAFKLSEYTKTGIPIINGESIKAGKISLEKVNYLPNEYQYKYQECLLFPGDIVLGLNRPIIDGELKISRIPSDIKTSLLYQRAGKIIFKVNMEENFTYQLLSKEVLTFTRREAVGSDQPFITTTKLNKWDLCLPVKDEERRMIGNLLDNINNIITLHQRKLDNLKLKKKALLQKLFPKNGERYPELRFPGFTDAWEQRKLGECMNSFAYGLNAAAKNYDGMHKYIRITDIDDETHNFIQSNLTSPDIDFNMDISDYKLNVGDIVFARTGASVGKTYLYNPNDGDLYYAGFLIRGKVKEDCDAGFIYQNTLTKDYDSFIKITSQRSGQPGVNSKEYATFRLDIPCKDEQEKISKVLNSLDELFTLHQRKLDHLQLQKKALLQQMFV